MKEPVQVGVQEVRSRMQSPDPPLLVLAYEDDKPFGMFGLEGAIPFSALQSKLAGLRNDQEIIFY